MTLQQLSGRWRLLIMTVLAAMPVVIATLMLRSDSASSVEELENAILSGGTPGAPGADARRHRAPDAALRQRLVRAGVRDRHPERDDGRVHRAARRARDRG